MNAKRKNLLTGHVGFMDVYNVFLDVVVLAVTENRTLT